MSKILKRNLEIHDYIMDIKQDPDDFTENKYMTIILLPERIIKNEFGLKLSYLEKILVSESKQMFALIFKYKKDNVNRQDIVFSKKFSKAQLENMPKSLPDNAYVALVNDNNIMLDSEQRKIEIKK